MVKDDSFVVEAFLMDARGALVCATRETTDYYQGDEPKWEHTYQEGRRVFVDEPALDASSRHLRDPAERARLRERRQGRRARP